MMKKRVISIVLCLAMLITGCSITWTISSAKSKPVRLNASKKTLKVGKKYQLRVKKQKRITIKKKTFTKKGAAVSVSKKGKVTAKKAGKATVICKVKYKKKGKKKIYRKTLKCKITVLAGGNTETPAPGKASPPAASQETQKPSVPEDTSSPINTKEPNVTISPDATATPTVLPDITAVPTASPDTTVTPTISPNTTTVPTAMPTVLPDTTVTPTTSPNTTTAPTATPAASPDTTVTPTTSPNTTTAPTATPTTSPAATAIPTTTTAPTETPVATTAPTATSAAQETKEPVKTPAPTQPSVEFGDSFQLIKDMGLGINLGNTMEACGTWIDSSSVSNYEVAWQVEKNLITADMIQGMRKAGFKTLRIPVAWSNMMSTDGTYTINEAYFNRVDQIIGYALGAEMYPIVNIHFDGGWWARFGSKDATERQEAMKKYKAMWTQLADHYKDYSNMLIFESANEELGARLNSTDDYENSGYYTSDSDLYHLTNEINQTFVDIVRASGGKNADRYLLIAGYDTNIAKTCDSRFEMPVDTITDHLMVSVHYYDPPTYCTVSDTNNRWGYQDSWGTEADIKEMQASLSKLKIRFTNQGIPVIIGEYGVETVKDTNARKEGEDLFFKNVCEYSLNNGICPVLWDIGFVYKRSAASMTNEQEAADYLELAARAESMEAFVPAAGDAGYLWKGTLAADNGGWNLSVSDVDLDNNTMILSSLGGCYALSGVDWSKYSAPKLKIKVNGLTQATIGLGVSIDDSNQYWCYIPDDQYKKTDTVSPSSEHTIDLSALNLSGSQSLYLAVVQGANLGDRSNFSGEFTLSISD